MTVHYITTRFSLVLPTIALRMSNPPEYRRRLDNEESAPLFKDDGRTSLELEMASTTYPPVLGQPSTLINEERPTVSYTFRPRKPDQGQKHSAIGVVGRTKAVSYFLQFIQLTSRTEPVISYLVLIVGSDRDSSMGGSRFWRDTRRKRSNFSL